MDADRAPGQNFYTQRQYCSGWIPPELPAVHYPVRPQFYLSELTFTLVSIRE